MIVRTQPLQCIEYNQEFTCDVNVDWILPNRLLLWSSPRLISPVTSLTANSSLVLGAFQVENSRLRTCLALRANWYTQMTYAWVGDWQKWVTDSHKARLWRWTVVKGWGLTKLFNDIAFYSHNCGSRLSLLCSDDTPLSRTALHAQKSSYTQEFLIDTCPTRVTRTSAFVCWQNKRLLSVVCVHWAVRQDFECSIRTRPAGTGCYGMAYGVMSGGCGASGLGLKMRTCRYFGASRRD